MRRNSFWRYAVLCALLTFAACSWFKKGSDSAPTADAGSRIAVLQTAKKVEADADAGSFKIEVPPSIVNEEWPQVGGNAAHAPGNVALGLVPEKIWSASIGSGSSKYFRLFAQPVVSGGKVFTLDSRGEAAAFSADKGDRLWRFDTTPPDHRGEAMGAGLAVKGDVVYVTTGFGEILALNAGNGAPLWRKMIGKPLRSAPTVLGDYVFAVSIDNQLHALSAQTGQIKWQHSGITESATLMGASSPAADGDSVVVAYSSGEIFNLRAQNGRMAWTDVLAVPEKIGALPAIADIRGLPVIDRGVVFAASHSGRMAAIDLRTGDRAWESDLGGVNTPSVVGDNVFVIDNDNRLVAMSRTNGRLLWTAQLQKLKDPLDRDSKPVFWWGPVMAGGRLWMTNSLGFLVAYDPENGMILADLDIGGSFFMPPIVANGTMYLLNDSGKLMALK